MDKKENYERIIELASAKMTLATAGFDVIRKKALDTLTTKCATLQEYDDVLKEYNTYIEALNMMQHEASIVTANMRAKIQKLEEEEENGKSL